MAFDMFVLPLNFKTTPTKSQTINSHLAKMHGIVVVFICNHVKLITQMAFLF